MDARRLAQSAGDANAVAVLDTNIASLYTESGDLEAAAKWIEGARERLSHAGDRREHLPQILIQLATIRARQQRISEALILFRQGIALADRAGDMNLYAIGWNRWGEELMKTGDLAAAEPALLEAYRVRKLNRLALDSSYRNLGRLRLEQGDLRSASVMLDRAVELAGTSQGQIPAWDLYHYRGRVRLAQGRFREALGDLRNAVRLGRAWRWSAPADDAGRMGAEGWLERVHSALIEAGNRLYLQTGDASYVRETFEALEENRASSLRTLRREDRGTANPPTYWEALVRLQRAEVNILRGGGREAENEAAAARRNLAAIEKGLENPDSGDFFEPLLNRVQSALDADTALFSFQLGRDTSWLWAVDRQGITLYSLPPQAVIASQVSEAARSVSQDLPQAAAAGATLYATLFGRLSPRYERKKSWLIGLDDALFNAPLAALVVRGGVRPAYLIESCAVQVIPGAAWWLEASSRKGPELAPLFIGIGDPIYNRADERLRALKQAGARVPLRHTVAIPVLPRLAASGPELNACALAWQGQNALLTGGAVSKLNIQKQLRQNPAIVHFATHMVTSTERPADGMIALSLTGAGEPDFLTPGEIADWRVRTGLIVLSGCHSAAGGVRPGTGLLGLTRSWLAAGADAVVSSQWDVPDENSALFRAFYREMRTPARRGPAQALRQAQLEMLRSGDWRAHPRYWGAYFVVGIEGTL